MLMAIDVGVNRTVVGLYKGSSLIHKWRLKTNKSDTSDELFIKASSLLGVEGFSLSDVSLASLASSDPQLTESWRKALDDGAGVETVICTVESAGLLLKGKRSNSYKIEANRIANAVAAVEAYGAPVVVIDFGAATTIEVIDSEGYLLGGIIAPGASTSVHDILSHGAYLSAIDLEPPATAIGKSTEDAIRSGIVLGEADRIDGLVRRIFCQLGYEAPVVATGEPAKLVSKFSSTIAHVDPELTTKGLYLIAVTR